MPLYSYRSKSTLNFKKKRKIAQIKYFVNSLSRKHTKKKNGKLSFAKYIVDFIITLISRTEFIKIFYIFSRDLVSHILQLFTRWSCYIYWNYTKWLWGVEQKTLQTDWHIRIQSFPCFKQRLNAYFVLLHLIWQSDYVGAPDSQRKPFKNSSKTLHNISAHPH